MASREELLTCPICLMQYFQPKSLPCLHTFCRLCIEKYAEQTMSKTKDSFIQCPMCKEVMQWDDVDSLKSNFIVQSLLDEYGVKRAVVNFCNECSLNGKSIPAVNCCEDCDNDYLCEECVAAHRRTKVTKEHKIVPITVIPQQKHETCVRSRSRTDLSSYSRTTPQESREQTKPKSMDVGGLSFNNKQPNIEMCKFHKNNQISTVCMDCKDVLCVLCLQDLLQKDKQKHSNHSIIGINESKDEIKKEIDEINEGIRVSIDDFSEQIDESKEYEEQLKEKSKAVIAEMKSFNNRLCQFIRKLGGDLEKDINKIEKEELQKIDTKRKQMETNLEKVKDWQRQLSQPLDESKGIIALFEHLKTCNKIKNQTDELINKKVAGEKQLELTFVPGMDLDDKMKESERIKTIMPLLGKIRKEDRESAGSRRRTDSLSSIPEAILSAALSAEVSATHKVQGASVSALTLGPKGELVIIDSMKCDMMVFSETPFHLIKRTKGLRSPVDIDILPDGNFVITEGKRGHCVSVWTIDGQNLANEIAASELSKATAIAVCSNESSIIVSDTDTAKIHIIKLSSGRSEIILQKLGAKNQFLKPEYVACSFDGTRFAVSDLGTHTVKVFRVKNGQFLFKYGHFGRGQKQLIKPEGICFDREGRLFICDIGNSRIHVVSPEGKLIGHILPKHFKKFEPCPNLITYRKDGCLVLANKEGWIKVLKYNITV